jgi:hypothetical protein
MADDVQGTHWNADVHCCSLSMSTRWLTGAFVGPFAD